jgi:hypothetical protein
MVENSFILTSRTAILCEGEAPVTNAAAILHRDLAKTLEAGNAASNGNSIRLKRSNPLPTESWTITVSSDEIVINYGDSLGAVYALLFISERFLGVAPFWYWNDQRFVKRDLVAVPAGEYSSPEYAVKFRGWFVNDEVLIENWGGDNEEHWRMVFEALLRCGGNMVIPGTDGNSRRYRSLAADMGLTITHHHAEPLGAENRRPFCRIRSLHGEIRPQRRRSRRGADLASSCAETLVRVDARGNGTLS